ncbi:MAG: UTP--glucose-1-phosphate uridylyltransferase [Anaerolineales bacterium]|nr:MAG: UTP--glucose-1-phosphate uridylyltransferase [Anaerolineales bacterium]
MKAVITIAGFGTRFLPASKAIPKELFPIAGIPLLQYHVEDLAAAGMEEVIIVIRDGGDLIERHFSAAPELEAHLEAQGKTELLNVVRRLSKLPKIVLVRQPDDLPYGNAAPALAAREWLGDEPFYYQFGDDIILGETPVPQQLVKAFAEHKPAAIVAAQEVPDEDTSLYGCLELKGGTTAQVARIVEKPPAGTAPSNLVQVGHFVFTPELFTVLDTLVPGRKGELWLADAVDRLSAQSTVIAHPIEGLWLAAGDPLRQLKANIEASLRRQDLRDGLLDYLRSLDLDA